MIFLFSVVVSPRTTKTKFNYILISMNNKKNASRRNFIRQSSLGLGTGILGISNPLMWTDNVSDKGIKDKKLTREICVASVDLKGLWPDTTRESRIKRILERMEEVAGIKPDLVCLPRGADCLRRAARPAGPA